MGRKKTAQTESIEKVHEAELEKGFTRADPRHIKPATVAAMYGISRQRVDEIWRLYDEHRFGMKVGRQSSSEHGLQPVSGRAAGKSDAADPATQAATPAPVVVVPRADRPDMSLVPPDADLAMWLSMPEDKWARDDGRTLDGSERFVAVLAMRSYQLVPLKTLQKLVGLDRAKWEAMLRADATLRLRLEAWRAKGVVKRMSKLSEIAEFGRDDIALSAAEKLLAQSGGAPEAFGPQVQRLQIESHHVEEKVTYLGPASLFNRPLDLAQRLLDEAQLQRGDVIEGEARKVPALPEEPDGA